MVLSFVMYQVAAVATAGEISYVSIESGAMSSRSGSGGGGNYVNSDFEWKEFNDYCYEVVNLAWVVCPIIKAISGAVDNLSNTIEGFFQ